MCAVVLEKPVFTSAVIPDVFEYKIFISGKTGVGKTSAVAKLSANLVSRTHIETPGITVQHLLIFIDELMLIIIFK